MRRILVTEQDKYQNILSQIHELNRQNLLTEYERNENVINKLDSIENYLKNETTQDSSVLWQKKVLYSLLILLILNIILSLLLYFSIYKINFTHSNSQQSDTSIEISNNEKIKDDVLLKNEDFDDKKLSESTQAEIGEYNPDENVFDEEKIEVEESYTEIKPIIKVDTEYSCEDDNFVKKYKIPYTVEIKGKLYADKFMFILKSSTERKLCKINKEDI